MAGSWIKYIGIYCNLFSKQGKGYMRVSTIKNEVIEAVIFLKSTCVQALQRIILY